MLLKWRSLNPYLGNSFNFENWLLKRRSVRRGIVSTDHKMATPISSATPQTAKLADMLNLLKDSSEIPTPYAVGLPPVASGLPPLPRAGPASKKTATSPGGSRAGVAAAGAGAGAPAASTKPTQQQVLPEDAHDVCNCRKSRCLKLYVSPSFDLYQNEPLLTSFSLPLSPLRHYTATI